jgi:hypothetical protein
MNTVHISRNLNILKIDILKIKLLEIAYWKRMRNIKTITIVAVTTQATASSMCRKYCKRTIPVNIYPNPEFSVNCTKIVFKMDNKKYNLLKSR